MWIHIIEYSSVANTALFQIADKRRTDNEDHQIDWRNLLQKHFLITKSLLPSITIFRPVYRIIYIHTYVKNIRLSAISYIVMFYISDTTKLRDYIIEFQVA